MDNDDVDNNAKISDSAYSASCSNSQSRSRSSKSTHSGSNSSGSSGYGGQPSASCNSNPPPPKRFKDKDSKKKKSVQTEVPEAKVETEYVSETPAAPELVKEEQSEVDNTTAQNLDPAEECQNSPDAVQIDAKEEGEFSCVISMHDGVVMYTTASLTTTLGFPKDMWIGRSFIDFIHARDRDTFASQITNGLAVPTTVNVQSRDVLFSTMVCRIRRYRGLTSGFEVKGRDVTYMPFLLKLSFKNINDETGDLVYLVVQATALFSAFKEPNEIVTNAVPFVMRHAADCKLEFIDPESVAYLGYFPQDIIGEDMLQFYHQDDLPYLTQVYETIVSKGGLARSKPYRMITHNRQYIKLETEFSSFVNPWSRKLEFVVGKHTIIEGPSNPDVFQFPEIGKSPKVSEEDRNDLQGMRDGILKVLNKALTKPAKLAKQQMSKRCQDLASFMESLMDEQPKPDDELRVDINEQDSSYYDRDSMLGGISPHHDCDDSKSSTETPPSYNQLNYNETLHRYFESHQPLSIEDYKKVTEEQIAELKNTKPHYSSPNQVSPLTQNFGVAGGLTSSCESDPPVTDSPVSPLSDHQQLRLTKSLFSKNHLSPLTQYFGEAGDLTCSCESDQAVTDSPVRSLGDHQQVRLTESLLSKHNADMEREMLRLHRETRTSSKGGREKNIAKHRQKKKEQLARCSDELPTINKLHGMKRSSKPVYLDTVARKHHCSTSRQLHRRHTTSTAEVHPSATITMSMASSHWHNNSPVNSPNTFLLGVGVPKQMPSMDTAVSQQMITMPAIPMQYIMHGQKMYGSPIMYSTIAPQATYPMPQTMINTNRPYNPMNSAQPKTRETSNSTAKPTIEEVSASAPSCSTKPREVGIRMNEETIDKTDGESSYSSFYSSFFKTESGSAEESDAKKSDPTNVAAPRKYQEGSSFDFRSTLYAFDNTNAIKKDPPRRKLEPKWMEQVCVTSELIYKYQVLTKPMEEVLSSDKEKINEFTQPSLVDEQLGQLYLDLQLEGVAARLTLEEGITSSCSSGEETSTNTTKVCIKKTSRKKQYSKLVMIYEEDAPFPSPNANEEVIPMSFTT